LINRGANDSDFATLKEKLDKLENFLKENSKGTPFALGTANPT